MDDDNSYLFPEEKQWRKKKSRMISVENYWDDLPYEVRKISESCGLVGYFYDIETEYLVKQIDFSLNQSKTNGSIINFRTLDHRSDRDPLIYFVKIFHKNDDIVYMVILPSHEDDGSVIIISSTDISKILVDLDQAIDFLTSKY